MIKGIPILLLVVTFLSGCTSTDKTHMVNEPNVVRYYLHLSHTHSRTIPYPNIDTLAMKVDYKAYDLLMLGGDLMSKTSRDSSTISFADSIFDLGSPKTIWSLGNHDVHHIDLVREFTGRHDYYVHNEKGICFIVLNTQDSLTKIVGPQLEMFNSVLDTISATTRLMVLSHKLFWMWEHPELHEKMWDIANGGTGPECKHCINPNNFYTDLYPRLVEAHKNGVEVLCVAGDIGYEVKTFEYTTTEGIHFLASGIKANFPGNMALLFEHNLTKDSLSWQFVPIESLDTLNMSEL